MKIIGLTGGIGSGKSTVLAMLRKKGAAVFVADEVAKSLMNTDAELRNEVIQHFGEAAYPDGTLNRAYLAKLVFNDKNKLQLLNSFVHPRVRNEFRKTIKSAKEKFLIYEAAILFESGSDTLCDYIILVTAKKEDRIDRVVARDQISDSEVMARMQHQQDSSHHFENVNFIIRNQEIVHTKSQVDTIFELLLKSEIK